MNRSLQTRLTLFYAAGVYLAGVVVLAVVTVPLAGVRSAVPFPRLVPSTGGGGTGGTSGITGTGNGIGPHQLVIGTATALLVLIPIALAVGWFVAGRFLRPLRAMAATATAISAGNLHQRLSLGAPVDELTELGALLDDLFARLQASFDAQRHFVANASHELRTPLAGLRTLLEVALADPDAGAEALRAACLEALTLGQHQERLVQALLALATSERGLTRREPLDLGAITASVAAGRRDQATQARVALAQQLAPAVTSGDPRLIESLITNLIDNAIRHNHEGGHAEITTQASGGHATLTVTNSGPVIAADDVERLVQPFQKLAEGRNRRRDGYGLGLAIVDAVAQAHHATLSTQPRPEGGLSITVRFTGP